MPGNLCKELGDILHGNAAAGDGVCKVSVPRTDIEYSILGIPTTPEHSFTFQMIPNSHKNLILGDFVLLEDEVPYVVCSLTEQHLIVSAIHNHWILDCPHLMYLHLETKMRPKEFAQKIACILEQLPSHRFSE